MYYLSDICFMCLKDKNKLQTVYLNRTEDAVKEMKYVLPEITLEPEIPVHICSTCHRKIHSFCTFKKQCLENYFNLTKKLRESGNAKNQSFDAFQKEMKNIKEENQMDVDLTNEVQEELNSQIHFITKEDTTKADQDETIFPDLNKNINEDLGMTDDIKSFECKEQYDQTNNFIEDSIKFEDSEDPNLYQELLSDIKKEIDINEIENADLNKNNSEHTISNLIVYSDFNQKINEESSIKEEIKVDVNLINEAVQDETISSDLNKNINEDLGMTDDIKSIECKEQYDQTNNFIEDSIKFEDSEDPNLYQELLSDIKKEIDINEIENADLNKNNSERTISNLIVSSDLNQKINEESEIKIFKCNICNKKFTQTSDLHSHIKIHSDMKNFQCSLCEKKFARQSTLNVHMKTHAGVKSFQCLICEKKLAFRKNLNYHMKLHAGVKNFQCSICEKKFIRKCDLNMHMKIHNGIKDFQCSICEKKYARKRDLEDHIKRHNGVKDFQCSICEKQFVRKGDLNAHMKTHSGIRDFECSICGNKFKKRSHFNVHMKTHGDVQ